MKLKIHNSLWYLQVLLQPILKQVETLEILILYQFLHVLVKIKILVYNVYQVIFYQKKNVAFLMLTVLLINLQVVSVYNVFLTLTLILVHVLEKLHLLLLTVKY